MVLSLNRLPKSVGKKVLGWPTPTLLANSVGVVHFNTFAQHFCVRVILNTCGVKRLRRKFDSHWWHIFPLTVRVWTVRNGTVRHGMIWWHGKVRCRTVWYSKLLYGMVRYGTMSCEGWIRLRHVFLTLGQKLCGYVLGKLRKRFGTPKAPCEVWSDAVGFRFLGFIF